jgi:hypothetical protein
MRSSGSTPSPTISAPTAAPTCSSSCWPIRAGRWCSSRPKYAAYLNLIEPWWKVLRALALAGRRFETWDEVVEAIAQATDYWNAHRPAFVWGRRRRHRPRRQPGIALLPKAA